MKNNADDLIATIVVSIFSVIGVAFATLKMVGVIHLSWGWLTLLACVIPATLLVQSIYTIITDLKGN